MSKKNVTLQGYVGDEKFDLMVKTTGENVYLDDETTLSKKMSEVVTAVNARMKTEDVKKYVEENSGGSIIIQSEMPSDFKVGDLLFQITTEE